MAALTRSFERRALALSAAALVLGLQCNRNSALPELVPPSAAASTAGATSRAHTEVPPMDREQQFIEDLNRLKEAPGDGARRKAFVDGELAAARLGPSTAVRLWRNAEKDLAYQAFSFLSDAEELAIVPALTGPAPSSPEGVGQTLTLVSEAELELRERVLKYIDGLLDDKRPIPPKPRPGPSEERAVPHRVCDEAYLTMRRMVHFGEDPFRQLVDARAFHARSDAERDAEIQQARSTKTWRRALRPGEVVDDDDEPKSGGPRFTPSR